MNRPFDPCDQAKLARFVDQHFLKAHGARPPPPTPCALRALFDNSLFCRKLGSLQETASAIEGRFVLRSTLQTLVTASRCTRLRTPAHALLCEVPAVIPREA